jgi:ribosomal protein L35
MAESSTPKRFKLEANPRLKARHSGREVPR